MVAEQVLILVRACEEANTIARFFPRSHGDLCGWTCYSDPAHTQAGSDDDHRIFAQSEASASQGDPGAYERWAGYDA